MPEASQARPQGRFGAFQDCLERLRSASGEGGWPYGSGGGRFILLIQLALMIHKDIGRYAHPRAAGRHLVVKRDAILPICGIVRDAQRRCSLSEVSQARHWRHVPLPRISSHWRVGFG